MAGMWGCGHQLELYDGEGRPMADAGRATWAQLLGQALRVGAWHSGEEWERSSGHWWGSVQPWGKVKVVLW